MWFALKSRQLLLLIIVAQLQVLDCTFEIKKENLLSAIGHLSDRQTIATSHNELIKIEIRLPNSNDSLKLLKLATNTKAYQTMCSNFLFELYNLGPIL